MSLRLRFAYLFTITIAILLLVSSFTIFYLYAEHRKNEYINKLKTEAVLTFDEFRDKLLKNAPIDESISYECGDNTLIDKEVLIFNANNQLAYSYPSGGFSLPTYQQLSSTKKQKEFYFLHNKKEFYAMYFDASKYIVIAAATDVDGFNKLTRLKYILFFVSLGCLIISSLLSYFIAGTALQPLAKLNSQIEQTTEQNLTKQIVVGNEKDEVSQIANNFNAMLLRLNTAFDIQKNFVHHASHELRTPLTTMFAQTENAINKNLSQQEYKQVLNTLKQEQYNLIELTNSLLLLFQFEKTQFAPQLHQLRVDELIYESISYCQKNFPGIVINFSFANEPKEDDLIINGNEALLKSAINNLIKNAFLYSINQKIDISLDTTSQYVELCFSNLGTHLSPALVANITQPFYSGENIGIKGIGLGLSIVHKIVTLHNGNFSYTAKGTDENIFVIRLNK